MTEEPVPVEVSAVSEEEPVPESDEMEGNGSEDGENRRHRRRRRRRGHREEGEVLPIETPESSPAESESVENESLQEGDEDGSDLADPSEIDEENNPSLFNGDPAPRRRRRGKRGGRRRNRNRDALASDDHDFSSDAPGAMEETGELEPAGTERVMEPLEVAMAEPVALEAAALEPMQDMPQAPVSESAQEKVESFVIEPVKEAEEVPATEAVTNVVETPVTESRQEVPENSVTELSVSASLPIPEAAATPAKPKRVRKKKTAASDAEPAVVKPRRPRTRKKVVASVEPPAEPSIISAGTPDKGENVVVPSTIREAPEAEEASTAPAPIQEIASSIDDTMESDDAMEAASRRRGWWNR